MLQLPSIFTLLLIIIWIAQSWLLVHTSKAVLVIIITHSFFNSSAKKSQQTYLLKVNNRNTKERV